MAIIGRIVRATEDVPERGIKKGEVYRCGSVSTCEETGLLYGYDHIKKATIYLYEGEDIKEL